MNYLQRDNSNLLEAFVKLSQYIVRLKVQQDIWENLGKFVVTYFPASWTAFAQYDSTGRLCINRVALPEETTQLSLLTDEVRRIVADVVESGFLASQVILAPGPSMVVFVPIMEDHKTAIVMLIGHKMDEPIEKDL